MLSRSLVASSMNFRGILKTCRARTNYSESKYGKQSLAMEISIQIPQYSIVAAIIRCIIIPMILRIMIENIYKTIIREVNNKQDNLNGD